MKKEESILISHVALRIAGVISTELAAPVTVLRWTLVWHWRLVRLLVGIVRVMSRRLLWICAVRLRLGLV